MLSVSRVQLSKESVPTLNNKLWKFRCHGIIVAIFVIRTNASFDVKGRCVLVDLWHPRYLCCSGTG